MARNRAAASVAYVAALILQASSVSGGGRWDAREVIAFMKAHPQRAYFSRLFRDGGFRVGIEVGVAGGSYSEHFLVDNKNIGPWVWDMMEPFPPFSLIERYPPARKGSKYVISVQAANGSWAHEGVGLNAQIRSIKQLSTDPAALRAIGDRKYDFIYLDGAHDHHTVKEELSLYWPKVAVGGVLAGHDYCWRREMNWTESRGGGTGLPRRVALKHAAAAMATVRRLPEKCLGCGRIPMCGFYTSSTKSTTPVLTQVAVVQAVQEWLVEQHPTLRLHHTKEDFTQESLAADGMSYTRILTKTRNPSWWFVKE